MVYRVRKLDEDHRYRLKMGRLSEADERLVEALAAASRRPHTAPTTSIRSTSSRGRSLSCTRVHDGRRTFHMRLEVCERGRPLMTYVQRLGPSPRRDELESMGGDPKLADRAEQRAELHRLRGDWKASAYHLILELPLAFTRGAAGTVMGRLSSHFSDKGFANAWAVHRRNEAKEEQVHGHCVILAGDDVLGRTIRPVEGSGEMAGLRALIADLVNRTAEEHGIKLDALWHGGSFADIGMERPPKERLPTALYKARQERDRGDDISLTRHKLALAADRIDEAWDRRHLAPQGEESSARSAPSYPSALEHPDRRIRRRRYLAAAKEMPWVLSPRQFCQVAGQVLELERGPQWVELFDKASGLPVLRIHHRGQPVSARGAVTSLHAAICHLVREAGLSCPQAGPSARFAAIDFLAREHYRLAIHAAIAADEALRRLPPAKPFAEMVRNMPSHALDHYAGQLRAALLVRGDHKTAADDHQRMRLIDREIQRRIFGGARRKGRTGFER